MRTLLLFLLSVAACQSHDSIENLVAARCGACHAEGAGVRFDPASTPALSRLIAQRVAADEMPPWLPSAEGLPLRDSRRLTLDEKTAILDWAAAGAPLSAPLRRSVESTRPPDAELFPDGFYTPRAVADDGRCFLLPPLPRSAWVVGYAWRPGHPEALHHVAAGVVRAAELPRYLAAEAVDAEPGWDCITSPGVDASPFSASAVRGGSRFDEGSGVYLGPGDRLVLDVHYVPRGLREPDRTGVALWLAEGPLREVRGTVVGAPVELPCPTRQGVRCDRKEAAAADPWPSALSHADAMLAACGDSVVEVERRNPAASAVPSTYLVETRCTTAAPSATVDRIHLHAHTRLRSARLELLRGSEARTILHVPSWDWRWEETFALSSPLLVVAGDHFRVSATFDNGDLAQWSDVGEPGHGGPAPAPRQPPEYRLNTPSKAQEMFHFVVLH